MANMAMTAAGYNSLDVVNLIMENLHLSQVEYDEKRQLPYATFAKLCRVHKSWLGLGRQHLFKIISEERLQMDRILKLLILLDEKPVFGQYVKHLCCGLIRAPVRRVIPARTLNGAEVSTIEPPQDDVEEGPELPTAFNDAMFRHLLSCLPNLKSVSINGFEYSTNPGIRIPAICTALSQNGQMNTLTKLSLHHIGGSREDVFGSSSESISNTLRHFTSLLGFKNLAQLHILNEDSPSFFSSWEWALRPFSLSQNSLSQGAHSASLRQLVVCHDPCLPALMDVLPTTLESLTVFRTSWGDCVTLAKAMGKISRFPHLKDLLLLSYYFVRADCMVDLFNAIASSSIERLGWSSTVSASSFSEYFRAPPTLKVFRLRIPQKHIDDVLTHIASLQTSLRQIILDDDSDSIGTPTWEDYHRYRLPYICNLEQEYRSMGIWLECKYKDKVAYLAPTAKESVTIEDIKREKRLAEIKEGELIDSARRRREAQEQKEREERIAAGTDTMTNLLARLPQGRM